MVSHKIDFFVGQDSIVRKIWSNGDVILFIFAGSAAEFALHKAVDWLYFTGKLPSNPLKRLFSTVSYARQIIFSNYEDAVFAIDKINAIHSGVEHQRGKRIPNWAYRDVLFMLIDYSIRSFELLERALTSEEKEEVIEVFYRMGQRMNIENLPSNYEVWKASRLITLKDNYEKGAFTVDLFKQYRKHLGNIRFFALKKVQSLLLPIEIAKLLAVKNKKTAEILLCAYKFLSTIKFKNCLKKMMLPKAYKKEILALDVKI